MLFVLLYVLDKNNYSKTTTTSKKRTTLLKHWCQLFIKPEWLFCGCCVKNKNRNPESSISVILSTVRLSH